MKLLLCTSNQNKTKEFNQILSKHGIEVFPLADLDIKIPKITENGKTFKENAILKAKALSNLVDYPIIADDSGLCLYSLKNKLGIYSSRFAKQFKNQQEANYEVVKLLEHKNRKAKFVCCIALIINNKIKTFQAQIKGEIVKEYDGNSGFGYDPIFYIRKYHKTFSELSSEEKNNISHRGLACKKLVKYLLKHKII